MKYCVILAVIFFSAVSSYGLSVPAREASLEDWDGAKDNFQEITDYMPDDDEDEELNVNLVSAMAEQDGDVAEALADMQAMQDSDDQVAQIQWGWLKKKWQQSKQKLIRVAANKAIGVLKKYVKKYPFVERMGRRLFCGRRM